MITLPSVTISGAPRSYQVVSIPIPDALAHADSVDVEIVPHGDFTILGPRSRSIDVASGRKTRLGVTIGIPAGALAGRFLAAEARFSTPDGATLVVPLEIDVNLVRQIVLLAALRPINGRAASDVILPFDIVNSGNARESVEARITLPAGWASRDLRETPIAVAPGETVKRRVRLRIPALSSTGSSFIQIELRDGAEVVASETMRVEVTNSSSIGRQSGPLLVTAISRTTDEKGRPSQMLSLSANGALYDSVRIDARMTQGSGLGGAAANAFAHLGTFRSSASVVLSAPSGQLSLGNTGTSFSDLTGLYPYGEGALLHLQNSKWTLTSMGALSVASPTGEKRQPMFGLRADRQIGDAQLFTSVSHLADAGASARRLDAIGVGAAIPSPFGSTFKAEIAERRFRDGSGFGWSSELERVGPDRNEQLRITHAPGGSDAFARAANELVANLSERLTARSSLSASVWRTTDATAVFSGLTSSGLSLRPQYALFPSTTVSLEMRSYLFDAASRDASGNSGQGFGTREQQIGLGFSTSRGQYYLNSAAYLGNVTRTVSPAGQAALRDRTPRNDWTTRAGWSGIGGAVEFDARIEQTRDAGGFVNQQSVFGIRGDQVVLPWFGGIRAEGELQRVNGFGNERSSIVRAGAAIPLINGFALRVDVEKNSIFHAIGGRVPWIFAARFEHALTVPMLRTPGSSGHVYEDRNGNQRRDRDEPGVAGAIVRRGSETAVADAKGQFRVGGDAKQPLVVDEASLPDGWAPTGPGHGDVGVSLTTSAQVELVVAPRSGFSDVEIDLSKAHVLARDSAGREWAARMTGPTTATFDALPVGTYTLEFDLSELLEPLVPRAPVAPLVVNGKESKSVTVTLDPRPIRMWNGPSKSSPSNPSAPHS